MKGNGFDALVEHLFASGIFPVIARDADNGRRVLVVESMAEVPAVRSAIALFMLDEKRPLVAVGGSNAKGN